MKDRIPEHLLEQMKDKIPKQLLEKLRFLSLEDAVRRDIKEWLRDLDRRISDIASIGEDDWKRSIKAAVRQQRTLESGFEFIAIVNSSTPVRVTPSDELLERYFAIITSPEYMRKVQQIVGERLVAGDLAGAYAKWREFESSAQHLDNILKRPNVRRGEMIARAAMAGNEAAHGTAAEKRARWQGMYDDVLAEEARGTKRVAAVAAVAERHGVKDRTIYRAIERLSKID